MFNSADIAKNVRSQFINRLGTKLFRCFDFYSPNNDFTLIQDIKFSTIDILEVTINQRVYSLNKQTKWYELNLSLLEGINKKIDFLMTGVLIENFYYEGGFSKDFKSKKYAYKTSVGIDLLRKKLGLEEKYNKRPNNFILKVVKPLRTRFELYNITFDFAVEYINKRMVDIIIAFYPFNIKKIKTYPKRNLISQQEVLKILKSKPRDSVKAYVNYNNNLPFDFKRPFNIKKPVYFDRPYRWYKTSKFNQKIMRSKFYKKYLPKEPKLKRILKQPQLYKDHLNIADAQIFEYYFNSFSEVQEEKYHIVPDTYFSNNPQVDKEWSKDYISKIYYDGYLEDLIKRRKSK